MEKSVIEEISDELKQAYEKKHPKKTNKEEAKWLSDKITLDKHFVKMERRSDGSLPKIDKESTILMRVSLKNADRWIKEKNKELGVEKKQITKVMARNITQFFDTKDLAKQFINIHPCYYDKSKNWWLWNHLEAKWEIVDEVEILNAIDIQAKINTINSKERNEIVEALRQVSRKNEPIPVKPTWIQFNRKIVDIKTGERFRASSQYFITNPIPYDLEEEGFEQTPVMDRIFEEWVGKDYVKTLYEIIAYCLLPDYPLNRLFCFVGSGMNGKSKFLELLRKFVGTDNVASTELDTLIASRFEITRLHKKLICQMGETNFNEMNKTSIIKKLTGGDLIGFEYKNKDPFNEKNYAKIIIATNNLPTTTDKTIGFYRRWLIIDFPNQFSEKKDILEEIPEEEYMALANKCCIILKDLLDKRCFYKEGSIEDRMNKYEARSDFLQKFLDEFTKESLNEYITKADFRKKFLEWCKENRYREMAENTLSKALKKKQIFAGRKYVDWLHDGKGGQINIYLDIKWKE